MSFKEYLLKSNISESSIYDHLLNREHLRKWCLAQNIFDPALLSYSELMRYIKSEREKGLKSSTINNRLNSISKYFTYMVMIGERFDNPAHNLRVKVPFPKVYPDLMNVEELFQIYNTYDTSRKNRLFVSDLARKRNLIVLGFLIFQGATATDLRHLKINDVEIDKGFIFLPESKRHAGRRLRLHPAQVIPICDFLNEDRQKLYQELKITPDPEYFFTVDITSILYWLFKELKNESPRVKSARHVRKSVIVNWLKRRDLRTAQYMAGHKRISSTERYQAHNYEKLQLMIDQYHPMG